MLWRMAKSQSDAEDRSVGGGGMVVYHRITHVLTSNSPNPIQVIKILILLTSALKKKTVFFLQKVGALNNLKTA